MSGKDLLLKVLIVEDTEEYQRMFRRELGERTKLLVAASLEEGDRLFQEHPDIAAVVVDACVPGDSPNSMWLVQKMRRTFTGPMIATSSSGEYRRKLMEAGCDHEAKKWDVSKLVGQLLKMQ